MVADVLSPASKATPISATTHATQVTLPMAFPRSAAMMATDTVHTRLLLFGGVNEKGYLSSELVVLEFDQKNVKELLKKHKERLANKRALREDEGDDDG